VDVIGYVIGLLIERYIGHGLNIFSAARKKYSTGYNLCSNYRIYL